MICWILLTPLDSLVAAEVWSQNLLDVYDDQHQNSVIYSNDSAPCIRLSLAFKKALEEAIKNEIASKLVYNCDLEFAAAFAGEKQRDFVDFCPDCAVLRFPFKALPHSGKTVEAIVQEAMNNWGSRWDYHADCGYPVGCADFWDLYKVHGVFTCVFNKTGFHNTWGQCFSISAANRSSRLRK